MNSSWIYESLSEWQKTYHLGTIHVIPVGFNRCMYKSSKERSTKYGRREILQRVLCIPVWSGVKEYRGRRGAKALYFLFW